MKVFTLFDVLSREVDRIFPAHLQCESLAANLEEAVRKHIRMLVTNHPQSRCKRCGTEVWLVLIKSQVRTVAVDAAGNDHLLTCPRKEIRSAK